MTLLSLTIPSPQSSRSLHLVHSTSNRHLDSSLLSSEDLRALVGVEQAPHPAAALGKAGKRESVPGWGTCMSKGWGGGAGARVERRALQGFVSWADSAGGLALMWRAMGARLVLGSGSCHGEGAPLCVWSAGTQEGAAVILARTTEPQLRQGP